MKRSNFPASVPFLSLLLLVAAAPPAPKPMVEAPPSLELVLAGSPRATLSISPALDLALAAFEEAPPAPSLRQELAAGASRVALPAAGSWQVLVEAPGRLGAEALLPGAVANAALPPLDLAAVAAASLVVESAGRPIAGALVLARPLAEIFPAPWRPATARTRSDARGRAALPAGVACEALVAAPGLPVWRGRLELLAGESRRLELAPGRQLELEVKDGAGRPVGGAAVAVDGLLLAATTSAAGRLAIVAPAGGLPALRVLAPGGFWASRPAERLATEKLADGAAPPPAAALVLSPPRKLALRVFDGESLRPLGGALLWPGGHPEILARSGVRGEAELLVPWGGATTLAAAAPLYLPLVAEVAQAQKLLLHRGPPPGLTLRGRVEDAAGQPIAGARLRLRPSADQLRIASAVEESVEASSGADGSFSFVEVRAGEVDLEAVAAGWAPALVRGIAVAPPAGPAAPGAVELRPIDLGTVVLERGVAIAGRVLAASGEPLVGAKVVAREPGASGIAEAESGEGGSFVFADFAAGIEIELLAEHRDARSGSLLVRVGEEAEVRLVLEAASRVAGRVMAGGQPVSGALVLLRSDESTRASARSGEDGRFELSGVKPGLLAVEAVSPGQIGEEQRFELVAGESVEDLILELSAGGVVAGRVTDRAGAPLEGVRVELVAGERELAARLAAPAARSDADGEYRLTGVPPGRRELRARRADLVPAERMLEIGAGEQGLDWQLDAGRRLAGRMIDSASRPVPGARITAFDAAERAAGQPAVTGADGRFLLEGLAAGAWRLVGEAEQVASAEKTVTIPDGGEAPEALLVAPAGASVEGRLLGASFEALARAQVWALAGDGRQRRGQVAYDGSYRIEALGPGSWRVAARAPGFPREASGRVELREAERGSLDLELSGAGYRLAGVVSRGGVPQPGVLVAAASEGGATGGAVTDGSGVFAIEALPAGSYQLTLAGAAAGGSRRVELSGDLDLAVELPAVEPLPDSAKPNNANSNTERQIQ